MPPAAPVRTTQLELRLLHQHRLGELELGAEFRPDGLGVPGSQGVHQSGVRLDDAREMRLRFLVAETLVPGGDQRLDHRRQRRPGSQEKTGVAELDERTVECHVEHDEMLVACTCTLDRRHRALDVVERARPREAPPNRGELELEPDLDQVVDVLGRETDDDHAPVGERLGEPLALEYGERTADRAAADRKPLRELRLDEGRSRGQRAVDDRPAEQRDRPARVEAAPELRRMLPGSRGGWARPERRRKTVFG